MMCPDIDRTDSKLTTRFNFTFFVRAAQKIDQPALFEFFTSVEKDVLRFRFLSAIKTVGQHSSPTLANVDYDSTENIFAFDPDGIAIIAMAMLAIDPDGKRAEIAMAIRSAYRRRGVSSTLLEHVARLAETRGVETLESIEAIDHHQAIEAGREMGFSAAPLPGDPRLILLRFKLGSNVEDL